MKIEQILVQHLFNHKELNLQGIGRFVLDPNVTLAADTEKETSIPENAVSFEYNPKAVEDDALIMSIVNNTKKIKPLASADLDSYLTLGKQFLNIGKPFTIEGLGTLDKTQQGALEFIPGQFITPKIIAPKAIKENVNDESSGLFQDHERKIDNQDGKKLLVVIALVLLVAMAGWAAWYFFIKKKGPSEKTASENVKQNDDSTADTTSKNNITVPLHDSSSVKPFTDGYNFKVVITVTNNFDEAQRSFKKWKSFGHKVILYTSDSVMFKVAEPFTLALSDTTRVKDSLNKYFYKGNAFLEK